MENVPQPSMPYQLTFEYFPDYLYALATAEADSLELSLAYWREIADEVKEKGYKKVLVEERIQRIMDSVFDMYALINGLTNLFRNIRVAFVDPKLTQHEIILFGELVATNRGILCKVFSRREEAEKWLQGF